MSTPTATPEHTVQTPQPRPAEDRVQDIRPSRAFIEATLAEDWEQLHPAVFDDQTVATPAKR